MSYNQEHYLKEVQLQVINYLALHESDNVDQAILDHFEHSCVLVSLTETKAVFVSDNVIVTQIITPIINEISTALTHILESRNTIITEITERSVYTRQTSNPEEAIISINEEYASLPLQADRTFDHFVVGDCNRESQAAALACAINPGRNFNPLFIYGNSGLGKTHLLMAIGNYVRKHNPEKKIYYIESLKFVDRVVKAIQNNCINEFKQYISSMDVLLVDDIQFLAGKEKSHEIFFSIYNELVNNRRQIVIASDRQPKEIKGLEDRLISRFSSGLSVGIDSPEFETSLAILKMKIQNNVNDINEIDEQGLAYIASHFSGNVRELEGSLTRVLFYAISFQKEKGLITFETVVNALKNQSNVSDKTGLSPTKIIKCVADYYGLTKQQITGKTRTKNISNARHIAMYLCRQMLDLPYIKIGDEFGGRDHTTIISACSKVEKQMKKDHNFSIATQEIEKLLNS